ncbi:hypothetical protein A2715_06205 [Candidatus Woesebacteria bacterium RIFCSPHIGHO2_01_FULL_39_32]|uniref:Uncharacterized protein n=2 Tax=Candidatus Woeseibacteriota TaxID=1752722 RepID=A0A0G0PN14_9BACT|nr:MAG: hypothetical protein UT61_C0033G0005 [Candidatus Woesebacteria bacterium GW2011_GWA1_39_8]OGM24560.1 MAG: hypothetical protein A2715_06205 [Candidatus Woesebacteria bacterium RIFCSPHIGHO2_01_FULL_39_32]OGM37050.1 MAG: hypothetical protein A3F01_01060 [Candidatus Woesebacteria bacterium RIFCSPHIGHO2_12_FULL_38_11]OGM65494.1 MAG: hypothetical protein A2893_01755 [Candidatus Woesebacteria bacterium RIFCSPLOWO2_01_FULL_39_25]
MTERLPDGYESDESEIPSAVTLYVTGFAFLTTVCCGAAGTALYIYSQYPEKVQAIINSLNDLIH